MFDTVEQLFIEPHRSIAEALTTLNQSGIGLALVVEPDASLLGTVTDGDVRRGLLRGLGTEDSIELVMNPTPITAIAGTSREELLELMRARRRRQIPLLANGKVVGVEWQDRLLNVSPMPIRTTPTVIMCGGLGIRLRPLTEHTPKSLLPVAGKPVLEHLIESLARYELRHIWLATNYRREIIEEHFGDGERWGVELGYAREPQPLGTAGALGLLREALTEPTLVLNGDLITGTDFGRLIDFHFERKFDMTICTKPFQFDVPYGVMQVDEDEVRSFEEKPSYSFHTNAGIYVLNPEVIELIPDDEACDMTDVMGMILAKGGRIGAFPVYEYWLDIGKMADYERANAQLSPRASGAERPGTGSDRS